MEEPTQEEKKFFEKHFKWETFEVYLCKICKNWQTPLPYDMFRHYLTHRRLTKKDAMKLLK